MMDRAPLPPPFAVGTRLRYLGTAQSWADAEGKVKLQWPGMETVVTEAKLGRRGTLRLMEVDEDSGEEIRDETRDGYSVWTQTNGHGRIIWPKDKHEWEVI
jgi:hypothetical protein